MSRRPCRPLGTDRADDSEIALGARRSRWPLGTDRACHSRFALGPGGPGWSRWPNLARIALRSQRSGWPVRPRLAFRSLQPRRSGGADVALRPGRPIGTWRPRRSWRAGRSGFAFRAWQTVRARVALLPLRSDGANPARFALWPGWAGGPLRALRPWRALGAPVALGAARNSEQRQNGGAGDSQAHSFSPPMRRFPNHLLHGVGAGL
jgi:hypothetical protein